MQRPLAILATLLALAPLAGAQSPLDAESRFNTAMGHLREGRVELAIDELKVAIKQDPKNPYFYKGLGVAHSRMADRCRAGDCRKKSLEEAVKAARKAIDLNPYYVDARNDLGIYLLRLGQREQGRKELITAFNDPTNPTPEITARNLGQAYFEDGNYAEARNWYDASLKRNKKYEEAWLGLADVQVRTERLDEAVRTLESAVQEVPDNWELVVALGEAYYRAGRFDAARPKLELAASKDPGGGAGRRAAELLRKFPD
jgi:Flp pilus assembly protein TadD